MAETLIIRALVTNSQNLISVAGKLDIQDFAYKPYRIIYNTIKHLAAGNTLISSDSIMAFLQSNAPINYQEIMQIGGVSWINSLYDSTYERAVNLDQHIQTILALAFNRRLSNVSNSLQGLAQRTDIKVDEKFSEIQQQIYNLSLSTVRQKETPVLGHNVVSLVDRLAINDESVQGIDISKYRPKLNSFLKRLQPGRAIIFNASAKAGKSSLILDLVWVLAGKMGVPVAVADEELNEDEQQMRLLSKVTGIDQDSLRNPTFVEQNKSLLKQAALLISKAPIYRFDASMLSPQEIETKVKLLQIQHGIKAFFWDHPKADEAEGRLDKIIGQKILTLKNRIANDCHIFCAAPMQRSATHGRVGDSYEPYRLADAVITFEEVKDDENLIATHKLTIELARYMPKGSSVYLNMDLGKQSLMEV